MKDSMIKYKYVIFLVVAVLLLFSVKRMVAPSLSNYPKLDSCFKTSVSKINLCSSNGKYVSLKNVSPVFIHSILISEDDSFYQHSGVDWNEFKNSLRKNLRVFKFARGGSTITQQLVKNVYLSQDKSIVRKVKEIYLAYQIDEKYSKSLILEKYLNIIELGRDIYGVKDAARHYFSKTPSQLNVLESLYLTVLLPNPKDYSASFRKGKLTTHQADRIKILLQRLLRRKRITQERYDIAKTHINDFPWTGLELMPHPEVFDIDAILLDNSNSIINDESSQNDRVSNKPKNYLDEVDSKSNGDSIDELKEEYTDDSKDELNGSDPEINSEEPSLEQNEDVSEDGDTED